MYAVSNLSHHLVHPLLQYLKSWNDDYKNWKRKTNRESKLIRNFDKTTLVPEQYFKLFMQYVQKMRGNTLQRLFDSATLKCEKKREEARKEIVELEKMKNNGKRPTVTEEMLQQKLKESVAYRRCVTLQQLLVLMETVQPSITKEDAKQAEDDASSSSDDEDQDKSHLELNDDVEDE